MKRILDYSAFLHTALMNKNFFNAFRFSATLKEPINPIVLQQAVNQTLHRYPLIYTKLTKDTFWYYLESLDALTVEEDTKQIFSYVNYHSIYDKAVSVLYKDKTITIEMFHSVSDGGGAIPFFKELIKQYLHIVSDGEVGSVIYTATFTESELEDSFASVDVKKYSKVKKINLSNTYQFASSIKNNPIYVRRYTVEVNDIKEVAKKHSGKINELLLTMFYKAIDRFKGNDTRNICLLSPVNLRQHFASKTLRNFTLCASILFTDSHKYLPYNKMFEEIRNQMNIQNTKENMGNEIRKLGNIHRNRLVGICPTWLKNIGVSLVYRLIGEKSCLTVSNLGRIGFDDETVANSIEEMSVTLSPRYSTPLNCGIISIHNKLIISVSHDGLQERLFKELEKEFEVLNIPYIISEV